MEEQQNHPMSHEEALDFAERLEHSIDRRQQQHPTTIVCPLCQTSLRRAGHTHKDIAYTCLCGATTRLMKRPAGQRIPVQGAPPNNAA